MIIFEPIHDGGQRHSQAVSFCLYDSPSFDLQKHYYSEFENFLLHAPRLNKDILIFGQAGMELLDKLPLSDNIRLFSCAGLSGYCKHFYRYLAASSSFNYDWVRFEGTDTPNRLKLEQHRHLAEELNIPIISFLRGEAKEFGCLSGSFLLHASVMDIFWSALQALIPPHSDWFTIDEQILSLWFNRSSLPILLQTGNRVLTPEAQAWVVKRLANYLNTVIISSAYDNQ